MRVGDLRGYLTALFPDLLAGDGVAPREGELEGTERSLDSLLVGSPEREFTTEEADTLIFRVARWLGVLRVHRAYFQHRDGETLGVRDGGGEHELTVPAGLQTYGLRDDRLVASAVDLAAGDRLLLFWEGDRWLALAQEIAAPEAGRQAGSWTHTRTLPRLRAWVAERHPGFELVDLTVGQLGASGRVSSIRLIGTHDESFEIEGLAVRWTLDLPDTLFTMEKRGSGAGASWVFRGRGLGHGVGLCQRGAYAMAQRGMTYREILTHYYSGVELMRLRGRTDR